MFEILFVRETVDQEIYVYDIFCSFERQSTKMFFCRRKTFLLIQETFDKRDFVCLGTTTATSCDFGQASICASWTGLRLGGPRQDFGPAGCWKSSVGASLTNQQAVRDKVMEDCP